MLYMQGCQLEQQQGKAADFRIWALLIEASAVEFQHEVSEDS
jgi:hypothetical protein